MGDFQKYYTGKKKAPVFTIFIGGNHEASNYLNELKYGGFVAPNIYYLGRSSVIWYKGLRIGGMSGVYWMKDFMKLNPESYELPFDRFSIRSIYHYRKDDYFKLMLMKQSSRMIMLSHDWPEGIYNHGDVRSLLKKKPFFKKDIENHDLGSPFNMKLLEKIRPKFWFSAHLHVKFTANVKWDPSIIQEDFNGKKRFGSMPSIEKSENVKKICLDKTASDEIELDMSLDDDINEGNDKSTMKIVEDITVYEERNNNSDEIELDLESDDVLTDENLKTIPTDAISNMSTDFLALDKCLPKRSYIEIIDIGITEPNHSSTQKHKPLYLDDEYIASQRVIEKYKYKLNTLTLDQLLSPPTEILEELSNLKDFYMKEYKCLDKNKYDSLFNIPLNSFVKTASENEVNFKSFENPQTKSFIKKFFN